MSARSDAKLVLSGEPRVQLLPQSVRDREKAAAIRRRLAMLVVLALVLVGGGYGYAWMRNDVAQQELATARQQTEAILGDQAQYSEGTRAAAQVDGIRAAQISTTANELLWEGAITRVVAMLPEGTTIGQVVGASQAPWEPPLSVEGPLRSSRVAQVMFTFLSPAVMHPADLVPRLASMPGYVDARLDSSVWDDSHGHYHTVVRVMFDADAASGRFATDSEAETETATEAETGADE